MLAAWREDIRDLLSRQAELRVGATFGDAREVLERPIPEEHILVYDLGTAHQDGASVVMELHSRLP